MNIVATYLKTLFMVYICEQHITIMARLAIIIIIIIHRHPSVSEDNGSVPPSLST